jgi:hypothetical protein
MPATHRDAGVGSTTECAVLMPVVMTALPAFHVIQGFDIDVGHAEHRDEQDDG